MNNENEGRMAYYSEILANMLGLSFADKLINGELYLIIDEKETNYGTRLKLFLGNGKFAVVPKEVMIEVCRDNIRIAVSDKSINLSEIIEIVIVESINDSQIIESRVIYPVLIEKESDVELTVLASDRKIYLITILTLGIINPENFFILFFCSR